MLYGYVRVSSKEQNEDRQMIAMREFGVEKIYMDKQSGKDFNRPEYQKMVRKLKAGDVLVVHSLDRFGRNYDEIIEQWKLIVKEKGADIVVLDMPLLDTRNDKNLTGRLIADIVLQLLAYVAQTEREAIRKRQREGIDAALARGVKFGRERMPVPDEFHEAGKQYARGIGNCRDWAKQFGVCENTFLRWCRRFGYIPDKLPTHRKPPSEEVKELPAADPAPEPPAKRKYNTKPKPRPYTACQFNDGVKCQSQNCAGCGWNPANARKATWSGGRLEEL